MLLTVNYILGDVEAKVVCPCVCAYVCMYVRRYEFSSCDVWWVRFCIDDAASALAVGSKGLCVFPGVVALRYIYDYLSIYPFLISLYVGVLSPHTLWSVRS